VSFYVEKKIQIYVVFMLNFKVLIDIMNL